MNRRTFVAGAAVACAWLPAVARSHATPEAAPVSLPVAAGLEASVARWFYATSDPATPGFRSVEARLASFQAPAQAVDTIPDWFVQVALGSYLDYRIELDPVPVETIGDTTEAMAGRAVYVLDEAEWYDLTALALTQDTLLYTFVAWSRGADVLPDVLAIARRTLGLEPPLTEPVPGIGYRTGGLWDLLPRLEHLPAGMVWEVDIPPCVGVFGINECEAG